MAIASARFLRQHLYRAMLVIMASMTAFGVLLHESYVRASRAVTDELRDRAIAIASTSSLLVSADDIEALTRPDQTDSFEYGRVLSIVRRIREANPSIRRIFIMRKSPKPNMTQFIVEDSDAVGDRGTTKKITKIGQEFSASALPGLLSAFEHASAESGISTESGVAALTGYAPILGLRGETTAILGVSIDATNVQKKRLRLLASATISFLVMTLLAATSGLLYLRKERVYRTNLDLLRESRQDLTRMIQAEKELTRKNRELQVLNAVSEHLSQSFELSRNLHQSLDRLLEVAGIDAAIVRMIDSETQELYLAAHRGLSPLLFEGYQRLSIGHSFTGRVAASGEALFVENIPATFGSHPITAFDRRIRSYAIVPLKVHDRILGTLTLFSLSDPKFPTPYKSLIFSFSQQLAVAVENANLFEKERNRSAQLTLVAEISKKALVTMDINQLLQMALERIQKEFRFFFLAYYEVDREHDVCVRKAECGGFFEMGYGNLNQEISLSEGMIGAAYAAKCTVYVPDTAADERFGGSPGNLAKSDLLVPVMIDGEVTGLFDLQSTMLKGFASEDILMMETLADQIGIAIKNGRLYSQLQWNSEHPETEIPSSPEPLAARRNIKVLVIDDEDYVRKLIAEVLSTSDYRVTAAASGEEGMAKFNAEKFDIVLTDLGMPNMNGWEVAKSVKNLKPQVPVVLLTGWGDSLDADSLLAQGVDRVIPKPFRVEDILSCMAELNPAPAEANG